jgi:hypothetical protein
MTLVANGAAVDWEDADHRTAYDLALLQQHDEVRTFGPDTCPSRAHALNKCAMVCVSCVCGVCGVCCAVLCCAQVVKLLRSEGATIPGLYQDPQKCTAGDYV